MTGGSNDPLKSTTAKMICAGAAGCTADLFTFPLDTVKVWLQVNWIIKLFSHRNKSSSIFRLEVNTLHQQVI